MGALSAIRLPRAGMLTPAAGRGGLAMAVLLGAVAGGLLVPQAALLSRVVDAVFLGGADLPDVAPLLLALAAVAASRAAAVFGQQVSASRFSSSVRLEVRDRLLRRVLAKGPAGITREETGELQNTLVGGVESLDDYLARYLPQVFVAGIVPLLILLAVAWADPLSALVLLVTYPLIPLFMWLIGARARESTERQWVTLSRLAAGFHEAVRGLGTLKSLGRAGARAREIGASSQRYRRVTMGVLRLAFLSALALELVAMLAVAVVAVEVGLRLLHGRVEFVDALFVLILAPAFYAPLRALGAAFHDGMKGKEASSRIAELLDGSGPVVAPAILGSTTTEASAGKADAASGSPRIDLETVRFSYDGGTRQALDDVSFSVPAGRTVALVGPTGSGKSTLAHLVLRFLEPDEGVLRVDGRPMTEWTPEDWRRRVAWVPQRPHLFRGSLLDNVRLGRPDGSREEVARAAESARLEALVDELPGGWSTAVGEGGGRLSGGEAQRVALARAFLKDAPVLVLDEPTGDLDPEHEAAVLGAMDRLRRGRTVLLIAHRLTTVLNADRILLLDHGRVVETGTHRELVASGGAYARLLAAWEGSR